MTKFLMNESHLDLRMQTSRVLNLAGLQSPVVTNKKREMHKEDVIRRFMSP